MHFQRKAIMNYSYSVGDVIGKGFSSIVYKGVNDSTNEPVAIKVIQRQFSESLPAIQNEISVLQILQGRNIIKLYEHFYTNHNIYIITEYCKQGDLGTYLTQYGAIQEDVAIKIMSQTIDGLECINKQNIIHRDFKPSNLLINDGVVKIADFGFAKQIEKLRNEMNLGTPLYMSPETITKNQYFLNSDVWSIGVVFFELLYGVVPWKVQTEQDLINQMVYPIRFPDQPQVSENVKQFIIGCLQVDPNNRFTVNQMKQHQIFKQFQIKKVRVQHTKESPSKDQSPQTIIKYQRAKTEQDVLKSQKKELCEEIVETQIVYCRFIKDIVRCMDSFKFESSYLSHKLKYILCKHLLYLNQNLNQQMNEENCFGLQNWNEFKESRRYQKLKKTYKLEDIENQTICANGLSVVDQPTFRQDILRFDQEFCSQIYRLDIKVILRIIQQAIIEYNHILCQQIPQKDGNDLLKFQESIKFLDNLVKYYKLLEQFKCGSQFSELLFHQYSDIHSKIDKKYEFRNYLELRQSIKQIINF